jgi:hypothetical protein
MNKLKIQLLNSILNYIYSRDWTNYDDFAQNLCDKLIEGIKSNGNLDLAEAMEKVPSSFLGLNKVSKSDFIDGLGPKIDKVASNLSAEGPILGLADLIPEIDDVSEEEAASAVSKLNVDERILQDTLRKAFRSKGASPVPQRAKDSPLEIADIEFFSMRYRGNVITIAVVVKGFNSVTNTRLSWEDIAHQVVRAYVMGRPDYIVVASAKEPKDSVITYLRLYGMSVEKSNLIVFVPPIDLAKLMRHMQVL